MQGFRILAIIGTEKLIVEWAPNTGKLPLRGLSRNSVVK